MKDMLTPLKERRQPAGFLLCPLPRATAVARLLLSPTVVLPAQFFPPADRSAKGEVALMRAVLEEALSCFARQFVV
jgi:hypothetical protein